MSRLLGGTRITSPWCGPASLELAKVTWDVSETVETLQCAIDQEQSPVLLRGLNRFLMAVEMRRFPHLLEETFPR